MYPLSKRDLFLFRLSAGFLTYVCYFYVETGVQRKKQYQSARQTPLKLVRE